MIPEIYRNSPALRRLWLNKEGKIAGRPKVFFAGKPLMFWADLTNYSLGHITRLHRQGKLQDFLKNKGFFDESEF